MYAKTYIREIYLDKNIQLELYTRPTCSDCQESKRYLNSQEISYSHKEVLLQSKKNIANH
jgi:glutaredoxin